MALKIDQELAKQNLDELSLKVVEKNKEHNHKTLYALTSGLELMKEMLNKTTKATAPKLQSTEDNQRYRELMQTGMQAYDKAIENGQDSGKALQQALLAMVTAMGDQRQNFAKYEQQISDITNKLQNAMLKHTKHEYKEMAEKLKKQEEQESWEKVFKWVSVAVMALVSVAMIATGNVAVGLLMASLTVATATGSMQKLTGKLGAAIAEKLGNSEKDKLIGKIIAAVVITVVVTALGAGVGAIDGAMTAVDEGASTAINSGAELTEDVSQVSNRFMKALKDVLGTAKKAFQKLPRVARAAVKGGASFGLNELGQSGFAQNLTALILMDHASKMSEKDKKIVEAIATAVVALASMVAGGTIMASISEDASSAAKIVSGIKKMTSLSDESFTSLNTGAQIGLGVSQVGVGVGTGAVDIELGQVTREMGEVQGNIEITQSILEQLQTILSGDTKTLDETLKQMGETQRAVNKGINDTFGAAAQFGLRG